MKLSNLISRPPVKARHVKRTFVSSPEDEASSPSREVINMSLDVVRHTMDIDINDVSSRMKTSPRWPDCWPGEHYKLLAGFVAHLKPTTVIEIGTHTGLSALSLKKCLSKTARMATYDLIPWDRIPDTCLTKKDFEGGQLKQHLADLSDPVAFKEHSALIASAELIFVDGPKDRKFEPAFARNLESISFKSPPWVIFDDIRDMNMLQFWRDIKQPKLDISSFGHWTGTGLVHWTKV